MVLGPPLLVEQVQQDLEKVFMCKWEGELVEYVGSKIIINHDSMGKGMVKIMQPLQLHNLM
jgi:hypothetical protein